MAERLLRGRQSRPGVLRTKAVPEFELSDLPPSGAERLQRDFGGTVVDDFADPLARTQAKNKTSIFAKIGEPSQCRLRAPVSQYQGRNVVIVDDVYNTGESHAALRGALAEDGLTTIRTAVLGASDPTQTTPRDIARLSGKLPTLLPEADPKAIRSAVSRMFTGVGKQFFNYAEREVSSGSDAVRQRKAQRLYGALTQQR